MSDNENLLICWRSANHGDQVLVEALKSLRNRKVTIHRVLYLVQPDGPKRPPEVPSPTEVELLRIHLADPTAHAAIYAQLRERLIPRTAGFREVHVNVSPGTPAMHAVWLVLHAGGAFPPGTKLWSSQFNRETKRTRIDEVAFEVSTYLSAIRRATGGVRPIATYEAEARSPARRAALEKLARYARLPGFPLLVLGERGTGKSRLVESFVLQLKGREKLVTVPCGGLDPNIADGLLFGHVRGAFTGADRDKTGLIQAAENGVLFLDEVQDLPRTIQRKLVRLLQDRRRLYRPVGAEAERSADVELVFASNKPLNELGSLIDPDLFDRIVLLAVELPPLRQCREDVQDDWRRVWEELRPDDPALAHAPTSIALSQFFARDHLPGNLRDLQRIALRIIAAGGVSDSVIEDVLASCETERASDPASEPSLGKGTRRERTEQFQRRLAAWAKSRWGTWREAAKELGCDEKTLREDAGRTNSERDQP